MPIVSAPRRDRGKRATRRNLRRDTPSLITRPTPCNQKTTAPGISPGRAVAFQPPYINLAPGLFDSVRDLESRDSTIDIEHPNVGALSRFPRSAMPS